ncbi:MAG: hypothetical protein JSR82_11105 [Verrucomicrobia bacterium]|nr:hypothetical protein [Verrucomicrobiota bacterium]
MTPKVFLPLAGFLGLTLLAPLPAQIGPGGRGAPKPSLDDAIYTAGLSTPGTDGRNWLYVVWKTPQAAPSNRSYAIYLQTAPNGTFTRQAVVRATSDQPVLQSYLTRAATLGVAENALNDDLGVLLRRASWGGTYDAQLQRWVSIFDAQPVARKLNAALGRALQVSEGYAALNLMAPRHPALRMALGQAWAGPLAAGTVGPVVVEVREWDGTTDGLVVGRVQLTPGQSEALTAPGRVVQVPDLRPQSDLTVKLRWAVPAELRRRHLHSLGFVAYRVNAAFAESHGLPLSASATQIEQFVAQYGPPVLGGQPATPNFAQVNLAPVPVHKLFDDSEVDIADPDRTTFFLADDANRGQLVVDDPNGPRFAGLTDGSRWFYFVRAVDLLGRTGPPSPLAEGLAVRTIPPDVPAQLTVADLPVGAGLQRHLVVRWRANANGTEANARTTQRYAVYRGLLPEGVSPSLNAFSDPQAFRSFEPIGYVPQSAADANGQLEYIDTTALPTPGNLDRTVWYGVCALHDTPLDGFFSSPHDRVQSAPAGPGLGVFRDRQGPDAPQGFINANCGRLLTLPEGVPTTEPRVGTATTDSKICHVRLRAKRRAGDRSVMAVQFSFVLGNNVTTTPFLQFPPDSDEVVYDQDLFAVEGPSAYVITCVGQGADGCLSSFGTIVANSDVLSPSETEYTTIRFVTGRFAPTEYGPGGQLAGLVNAVDFAAATPVGPATVQALLPNGNYEGQTIAVQGRTTGFGGPGELGPFFVSLGAATVRNGVVYFAHPGRSHGDGQSHEYRFLAFPSGSSACHCLHDPRGAGPQLTPITVGINLPATTREWRIFRRVDDGDLSLVRSSSVDPTALPPEQILVQDKAMPPHGSVVRYFAQCFDQNNNPSPLTFLGKVVLIPDPTQPLVNTPEALLEPSDASRPEHLRVRWFCPAPGVARFQVFVVPINDSDTVSGAATIPPGSPLTQGDLPAQYFKTSYLVPGESTPRLIGVDRFFSTPSLPVGSTTAVHQAELRVVPGVTYVVYVAALGLDDSKYVQSKAQLFTWKNPSNQSPTLVAWPARPLPPVLRVAGVDAVRTSDALQQPNFVPAYSTVPTAAAAALYPVVVTIGYQSLQPIPIAHAPEDPSCALHPYAFSTRYLAFPTTTIPFAAGPDPNAYLFPGAGGPGVLFRQTLGSNAPGSLVQVSPLRPAISYRTDNQTFGDYTLPVTTILDPFVKALTFDVGGLPGTFLTLTDTHPVQEGEAYRYYLVKYRPDGEIQHVIDCGTVTIPETP